MYLSAYENVYATECAVLVETKHKASRAELSSKIEKVAHQFGYLDGAAGEI